MRKITLTMLAVLSAIILLAQTPQAFKYQAVARDSTGNILSEQNVSFQISILQGSILGSPVYVEKNDTTTNAYGFVNLEIGNGEMQTGILADIDWGGDIYFLQIEMDENGGDSYQLIGTSQLLSVPYSMYSETSGNAGAAEINELTDGKTTGNSVFLGSFSGINDDSTNNRNVAIGKRALNFNTSGENNTAIGYRALYSNNTGENNTALGFQADYYNLGGTNNTMIGLQAGMGSSTHNKSGNIFLGYKAGYNDTTDNKLYIENSDSTDPLIYGDFENDILAVNGSLGVGTSIPSEKLEVNGNAKANTVFAMAFSSNSSLLLQTDGSTRIYVDDATGNVGIGTMQPQSLLSVGSEGSSGVSIYGNNSNGNYGYLGGGNRAVQGTHSSTGNWGYLGSSSYGAVGIHNATGNYGRLGTSASGVHGQTLESTGKGVSGYSIATNGENYGGYFTTLSTDGISVYGLAIGSDGTGVEGVANGYNGCGVYGLADGVNGRGVIGNGNLFDFFADGIGTDFGSSQSKRWSNNITKIDDPISKIMELRGVYFNWNEDHGSVHDVGMIAEEVGRVLPEIVTYEENGIDAIGMDYGKLTPLLVEVAKAQQQLIEELIIRVEELEQIVKN